MNPATECGVAHLQLAWWQEEMRRLGAGSPVHPISVYLAQLPRATAADFHPLVIAVDAAAGHVGGVPLERGADLEPHTRALWGGPLALASRLAVAVTDEASLQRCTTALAAAHYLARAVRDYRCEARAGRIPFAIDELIAARIDNDALVAEPTPAHFDGYLEVVRERAAGYFDAAARALPRAERRLHRHLLVLAALGLAHLHGRAAALPSRSFADMLLAWRTAHSAHK
ncbi:MAG: hypothetical protein NVS9B2_06700 [Steroidobacteraceae bacterium]